VQKSYKKYIYIKAIIKSTVNKILNINLLLIICTDLKSLYNYFIRLSTTQEKRLIINIICLWQAYKQREIIKIKWINSNTNLADIMIKSKPYLALT
jgi:hypothetical protein